MIHKNHVFTSLWLRGYLVLSNGQKFQFCRPVMKSTAQSSKQQVQGNFSS